MCVLFLVVFSYSIWLKLSEVDIQEPLFLTKTIKIKIYQEQAQEIVLNFRCHTQVRIEKNFTFFFFTDTNYFFHGPIQYECKISEDHAVQMLKENDLLNC